MKLFFRRIRGVYSAIIYPGFGSCYRCYRRWPVAEPHETDYGTQGCGCFPLCEDCWSELSIYKRMAYYMALYGDWIKKAELRKKDLEVIKELCDMAKLEGYKRAKVDTYGVPNLKEIIEAVLRGE